MSSGRLPWRRAAGQHSFLADLRAVLAERNFRRLFATRLISQTGDGMFTAGLGTYVFFNATSFPDPGAAAAAFAVLVPAVLADRAVRRRVHRPLVTAADPGLVGRAAGLFVALTASLVASGRLGVPLYVGVLAVLGVNRFFLSSLSAALPHVVSEDTLVMANSVAPTVGTIVSFLGGLAGLARPLRHRRRAGRVGGHPAGRRRVLPDRGRHRRDHAPRPARAAPAGRGRAAARAAGRARDRGQRADQRRAARLAAAPGGGRARGDRRPAGDVRDLAAHLDPALPQLLLPGVRRQLRARPLHAGDHRRGDRLRRARRW